MNIEEIIAQVKLSTGDMKSAMTELNAAADAFQSGANKAVDAYFSDVEKRKKVVEERIKAMENDYADTVASIEKKKSATVAAAVEGNDKKLNAIQMDLDALETRRTAIKRKIAVLESTPIPGNPELFKTASQIAEEMEQINEKIFEAMNSIHELSLEQVRAWEWIEGHSGRDGFLNFAFKTAKCKRYDSMVEHFNAKPVVGDAKNLEEDTKKPVAIDIESRRTHNWDGSDATTQGSGPC